MNPGPLRVTRDTTDPSFPHGQARGYGRGCTCPRCVLANRRQKKRVKCQAVKMQPAAPLRPKVMAMVEAAGSFKAVQRRTGIYDTILKSIRDGQQTVHPDTAAKIRAVNVDALRMPQGITVAPNGHRTVPKGPYVDMLRRLQANGHTLADLNRDLGWTSCSPRWMATAAPEIEVTTAEAVTALYRRLQNTPGCSSRARGIARRLGYYPPAAYDENGQLDLRSIPEHPWAKLDDRCARTLLVAQALLADHQVNRSKVAETVGLSERQVHRLAQEMGLLVGARQAAVDAAQGRYGADIDAWHANRLDTVHAAFRTGLVTTLTGPNVSKDVMRTLTEHPGYRTWLAEQDARAQRADAYEVAA